MSEIYWIAHYDDGTSLVQSDDYTYSDIDRDRLHVFDLRMDNRLLVRVDLRKEAVDERTGVGARRLIWRIRHRQDTSGGHVKFHLVGWQRDVMGCNIQSICYVFEDGSVFLGGQFAEHDFQHAIVPLSCETDL